MQYEPLLSIELDHVIPDELHLLLRVMDVLIRNTINSAVGCDNQTTRGRGNNDVLKGPMLKKLHSAINGCGVKFNITKKDKDSKLEWTSLVDPDKLKVLREFPKAFHECQPADIADKVKTLWEVRMKHCHRASTSNKYFHP